MSAIPFQNEVYYPESDGKPLGETEFHQDEIRNLICALQERFHDAADVHVGGDLFLYYVEGDPRAVVCPDVFVIRGVDKRKRRIYKFWEEGWHAPSLVVEVTSRQTRREDLGPKKDLYERLGVEEYFLYDPLGEWLKPRLQGFRLTQGRYQPIRPGKEGALFSEVAGLVLRPEGEQLRLDNPATGRPLYRWNEVASVARVAQEQLEKTQEQLEKAQEQLDQTQGQLEKAQEQLDQEKARAAAQEAELNRLRRELESRRG